MSEDPYSEEVRQLFADPAHGGELDDAMSVQRDDQGVRVRLALQHEGDVVRGLRFRAWGCPHLIAACEAFCRGYEGRPVNDLEGFEATEIMRNLSIPVEKTGRILVLEDAVRSLGRSIGDSAVTA